MGNLENEPSGIGNVQRFSDFRQIPSLGVYPGKIRGIVSERDLVTLTFNTETDFSAAIINSNIPPIEILEMGKNPGLGVRSLHQRGITGQGVTAAIIDQPLLLDHPEFCNKIIQYKNFVPNSENKGSMHGPGVTSLLVGNTVGVAPEATLYYAASPSGESKEDNKINSLNWIIEENKKLPPEKKIRVVSVSSSPTKSKFKSQLGNWVDTVSKAREEGILVLDCTDEIGIVMPGYYDYQNPEDVASFVPGFPHSNPEEWRNNNGQNIFAPVAPRTVAEQYIPGEFGYTYGGTGGLSWAIPYVSGVLCLGWQIAPQFTPDQMLKIMFDTAWVKDGNKIINPVAFIDEINNQLSVQQPV